MKKLSVKKKPISRHSSQAAAATGALNRVSTKKLTRLMSSDNFKNLQVPDSEEERAAS